MSPAFPRPRSVWEQLKRFLLRGFLVWIPLAAVYLAGRLVYGLIQSWIFPEWGWEPRVAALAAVLLVLVATGWIVTRFGVARYILGVVVERPLERIPVARWIYSGVRRLLEALFSSGNAFGKVVLVEYPRRGAYSLAFQMAGSLEEVQERVRHRLDGRAGTADADGAERDVMAVFVPTTPNPTSGVVITLPREEVIELDMTRQQALQMIISLGVVVPRWDGRLPEANAAP